MGDKKTDSNCYTTVLEESTQKSVHVTQMDATLPACTKSLPLLYQQLLWLTCSTNGPLAGQPTVLTSSHLHQLHLADKNVNTHAANSTCSTQVQANQTNSSTILPASKILQKSTKVHKKYQK